MSLAKTWRNLRLSKNQRILRENGVLDECGVHTQEGRNLMWAILFDEYEDQLVTAVEAQLNDSATTDNKSKK